MNIKAIFNPHTHLNILFLYHGCLIYVRICIFAMKFQELKIWSIMDSKLMHVKSVLSLTVKGLKGGTLKGDSTVFIH